MPLAWNRYGKARIRLVKLRRVLPAHELVDLTIDVQVEGAFDAVYVDGNNQSCLPTDTMKNSVYALARQDPIDHVETFAVRLAEHFAGKPEVSTVRIAASEHGWHRLDTPGLPDRHAFIQAGREEWTTEVVRANQGTRITSGLRNLIVLKTSHSRFEGFLRDEYTTLEATADRILATSVTAAWRYREGVADFGVRERIRLALVATFATHDSRSIQHTLYAMGEAALAACNDVSEVTLSLPNRHHLLVNLAPFGLDNPNDVFVATDEPYGLIEATVRRSE
jgi:urate oxidase